MPHQGDRDYHHISGTTVGKLSAICQIICVKCTISEMSEEYTSGLTDALHRLAQSAQLPAALRHLRSNVAAINAELGETVLAQIPAFTQSQNPEILPELSQHGPQHTKEILRLLDDGQPGDFDFVREHARRRASQHFPLEATLHAYRCGQRVFSRWVREAVLSDEASQKDAQQTVAAVADFAMEYTDAISTIAAGAYLAQTRLMADVAGDQRAELLTILLDGYDESDGRVANILRSAGYLDARQSFCVALAQPVDPAEMLNPARARRLADSIHGVLRGSRARRVIDIRDNKVTIVFSATRRVSGWTVPKFALAKQISSELLKVGNAALIGVSNDVPSTSKIPTAYREAALALELADVTQRVTQFSDIPLQRLALHLAGEKLQRVLPMWAHDFSAANSKSNGKLIATLRAYAGADMNVLKAADAMSIHPNTIYSRFQKIQDITGLDARSFHVLSELLVVAAYNDRSVV